MLNKKRISSNYEEPKLDVLFVQQDIVTLSGSDVGDGNLGEDLGSGQIGNGDIFN